MFDLLSFLSSISAYYSPFQVNEWVSVVNHVYEVAIMHINQQKMLEFMISSGESIVANQELILKMMIHFKGLHTMLDESMKIMFGDCKELKKEVVVQSRGFRRFKNTKKNGKFYCIFFGCMHTYMVSGNEESSKYLFCNKCEESSTMKQCKSQFILFFSRA